MTTQTMMKSQCFRAATPASFSSNRFTSSVSPPAVLRHTDRKLDSDTHAERAAAGSPIGGEPAGEHRIRIRLVPGLSRYLSRHCGDRLLVFPVAVGRHREQD